MLNPFPGLRSYDVLVSDDPESLKSPSEPSAKLRAVPRCTARMYFYLAYGVEVLLEHHNCGLVPPQVHSQGNVFDDREPIRGLFEVHVCKALKHKPLASACVAVRYRSY